MKIRVDTAFEQHAVNILTNQINKYKIKNMIIGALLILNGGICVLMLLEETSTVKVILCLCAFIFIVFNGYITNKKSEYAEGILMITKQLETNASVAETITMLHIKSISGKTPIRITPFLPMYYDETTQLAQALHKNTILFIYSLDNKYIY